MNEVHYLGGKEDLELLMNKDVVKGMCCDSYGKAHYGEWVFVEPKEELIMRVDKSVAVLNITWKSKEGFKFLRGQFYFNDKKAFYLDFFNSKTEEFGNSLDDYLKEMGR